jgi:mono/diheme cytochrome c family protein
MRYPMTFSMIKSPMISAALTAFAIGVTGPAMAAPKTYELPEETAVLKSGPAPGFEAAKNNCSGCHSADYVNFQPPKKGQAFWDAEVQKMIKVYGAPIGDADAKAIADYLAKTY